MNAEHAHAAEWWHGHSDGSLHCDLCPQRCVIKSGRTGICHVRGAVDGQLVAPGYGRVSSANLDPVEKKPLYHFHPGSTIFSVGGWGCNLRCSFCQNWSISQHFDESSTGYMPRQLVQLVTREHSLGIAYTYNEPLVGIEYVEECASLCRESGLVNVMVTNGFINPEPAARLLPMIDALNIDIKSMQDQFYIDQCGGKLGPVLSFARQARQAGCHVEITNLVIPGLNDSDALISELATWIARNLGQATPLHLSAYFPRHKLRAESTSVSLLEHTHEICLQELDYVYLGNVMTGSGQDTFCPQCGSTLISRQGYRTRVRGISGGNCAECGRAVDVVT